MNKRSGLLITGVAAVVIAGALYARPRSMDDQALRAALVGTWRATDLENASLHHHKNGVAGEEADFSADGKLVYRVSPKAGDGEPKADLYTWEIVKGKLQLRDAGEGSVHDVLPKFRISVSGDVLNIRRRNYSEKVFHRVAATQPVENRKS